MRTKRKNNALLPVILFSLVIILSIGGLVLAQNMRRSRIANPGDVSSQDQIHRLTVAEAHQAVLNGEAVLLDTRGEAQFNAQRANGAINIPVSEIEARLGELDPDTWYITYCT
jgi:hypothetical protein